LSLEKSPRPEKVLSVSEIRSKFEASQAIVLTNYRGINVKAMTKLRKSLREAGVEYRVIKNSLARIALHDMGIDGLDTHLEGPTAIAFGLNDPVAPAKVLRNAQKDIRELEMKAGLLGKNILQVDGIKALADLPSKEVLLARVAGCFASPLTTMVSLLAAPLRNVGYGLEAIRKKKEAEAQA